MFCIGYARTLLEVLIEEIVGIHEVARTFLEALYVVLVVVVLCKVGILYLLVYNNLLHSKSLHEVVRKFPKDYGKYSCIAVIEVIQFLCGLG